KSTATPLFVVTGSSNGSSTPPPILELGAIVHVSGTLTLQSLNISGLPQSGFGVAELAGKTGDAFDFESVGGAVPFQDSNGGDRPAVTADFTKVVYTNTGGSFTINSGDTSAPGLSALKFADISATAIKLFLVGGQDNANSGEVTWVYALRDNA